LVLIESKSGNQVSQSESLRTQNLHHFTEAVSVSSRTNGAQITVYEPEAYIPALINTEAEWRINVLRAK